MRNVLLTLLFLAAPLLHASEKKADPILEAYVKVAADLAADDLEAAKGDAAKLATAARDTEHMNLEKDAAAIAGSQSIDKARESFKAVSKSVIPLAKDTEGYYVMTCPMTKDGDWVQDDPQIANPYFGSSMLTCGMIKKDE